MVATTEHVANIPVASSIVIFVDVDFNAAVDGYPMLHAEAKTVASRNLPNGVEYLFTAVDLPREDNPKMPPAGELKVYVTVENGAAPVFTNVVR